MPIRDRIVWLAKSIAIGFLLALPLSYIMTALYLDSVHAHASLQEFTLVMIVLSFISGIILQNYVLVCVSDLFSFIFAVFISASIIVYNVFLPFINVEDASSLLTIIFLTSANLIDNTFIIVFFLITPFIPIFGVLGVFISQHLMESLS